MAKKFLECFKNSFRAPFKGALVFAVMACSAPSLASEMAPQVAQALEITLKADAHLDSPRIYLKDIATCVGMGALCEESGYIDLGASPKPGISGSITRREVETILFSEFSDISLSVMGPDRTHLRSRYFQISATNVHEELRTLIEKAFINKHDVRVNVANVNLIRNLKFFPGEFSLEFPELSAMPSIELDWLIDRRRSNGEITVVHRPVDEEVSATTFKVRVKFVVEKKMPLARRDIGKGRRLKMQDFYMNWVTLDRRFRSIIPKLSTLNGLIAKRNISMGTVVMENSAAAPKLVKRGQFVEAVVTSGRLTVKSRVKALAGGSEGDTIRVMYLSTKKRVTAKVLSAGKVRVLF